MILTPIAIRRAVAIACVAGAAVPLAACSPSAAGGAGTAVVASFYPIAEAARQVGGDLVTVTNLTAPGVEPHDLELTPRQLQDIAEAEVVLYLGGGFQPAIDDAIGDARGDVVDVGEGIPRHAASPGSEAGLTTDPHLWLDPVLYERMVATIASALERADPDHRATFVRNADAYTRRLDALANDFATGLSGCDRNEIVTTHAAFGYLAARYGLRQEAISGLSPDAEPTPQRLAELKSIVERDHVTTIFTEELVSPKVAETLARETGATTAVLSPLESLTPSELAADDDYVSVMRANLGKLEAALGCS
jgi:zinc transport system substrate-binding protein